MGAILSYSDYSEREITAITTGGMVFNYACPKQTNSCVRRRIVMRDPIDTDVLEIAMEFTRRRYPQLSLGLTKTKNSVVERHIEAPFRLNPITQDFHMMGSDTNGHMIAFYVEGTMLLVDFFHAIADDAGMDRFIQTLLYTYLDLKGYDPRDAEGRITRCDGQFDADEGEDVGLQLLDEGAKERPGTQPKKAFKIKGRRRSLAEPDYAYTLHVDLKEFKAFAKLNGVTPTVVISTLFSRVLYRHYSAALMRSDNPITAEVAVNLRNHFPSNTVRNFVGNAYLQYDAALDSANIADAFHAQSRSLSEQNTPECQIAFHNHAMLPANKWFGESSLPGYAKNWIHKHIAVKAMSGGMTYGISNIGKEQLPECLKPHIEEYYSMIPSGLHAYLVSMRSEGDVLTLCITSKLDDSVDVVAMFAAVLCEFGVSTTVAHVEDFYYTKYVQGQAVTPTYESKVDLSPIMDKIMARSESASIAAHELGMKVRRRRAGV